MWFLQAFGMGFAITLGVEIALGLCIALKHVTRRKK
jgi:hypothetical protein